MDIDSVYKWITPVFSFCIILLLYIWRTKIKDIENRFGREEQERKIKDEELIKNFKEGLREERLFRMEVLQKHDKNIDELFSKINDLSILVAKLEERGRK